MQYEDKLRREQTKQEDESSIPRAWVERTAMFARDVDKHKEQAIRLDRINEALSQRVDKYKTESKMREDDREYLVRQMVALKKDNERLKKESERLNKTALTHKNHSESKPRHPKPEQEVEHETPAVSKSDQDELTRYKEVYKRLKKMLEHERKANREVR
eukprot:768759-Hanusia_phi.AAC.14